jgi:protein phosphatase PTC2/3
MEDAHAAVLDLQPDENGKPNKPGERLAVFGVYDGHGGDKVALFAGKNVHRIIAKQDAFKKGDIEQALKDGFLATDRAILSSLSPISASACEVILTYPIDPDYEEEVSGCTASVAILSKSKIWVVCSVRFYCSQLMLMLIGECR